MPARKHLEKHRLILDLPDEISMAIRLHALKKNLRNVEVVSQAIRAVLVEEIAEAKAAIAERNSK